MRLPLHIKETRSSQPNTAEVLQWMTHAYVFEKELCEKCAHLTRVVRAIGSGSVNPTGDPLKKVEYLIFEQADDDIRGHLDASEKLDILFLLRTLHGIAVGLSQLHWAKIAHQDLKPSNVLVFGGEASKVCDLGMAWDQEKVAPHDSLKVAGDPAYAPIEAGYGYQSSDMKTRRFGCDLYHLGNLVVFLFSRLQITTLITANLAHEHRPGFWGERYEDVLPYVQASFVLALGEFASHVPDWLRQELVTAVGQLCDPDPRRRGHPRGPGSQRLNLQRYVSLFDLLARRAKYGLYKERFDA